MPECFIRKNGSSFFAIGLDGEKKLTFFSAAMQKMKHQGFDFRRHLYLEEDTFNVKKREIIFFSIIYQIFYSKCSFANRLHCSKLLFFTAR